MPNLGTSFHIYLPAAITEGSAKETTVDALVPLGGTETVLLAEDSPAVRAAITDILERSGFTVIAPVSSLDALLVSKTSEPKIDLLLTDMVMPGISGRLLAEEFKRTRPKAPVLFMSGYTDDAKLLQEIRSQRLPLLPKPFTPATLVRRVREVLGEKVM
ncbi:MAG: Blue-light-activated protein [Gemmatimonadetes bacterium]|nr:Blue-light-activated protein [Gemmatimonadota bacterium]